MVHALTEAQRVLKPDGILIDLRPTHKHRRAGLGMGKDWQMVGVMREDFADDLAADHAVTQVVRSGLFQRELLISFDLDRVMDTLQDFHTWLTEFNVNQLPSHEWLYQKVERALARKRTNAKITVRGSMRLGVMRKLKEQIE